MDDRTQFITELYQKHWTELHGFLRRHLTSEDEATDIAQEVYLRVASISDPQILEQPRAFLYKIASNLVIDRCRAHDVRSRHRDQVKAGLNGKPAVDCSPEDIAASRQELDILFRAIVALPPTCRRVFVLHKIHNLDYREIQDRLGMSRHAVAKNMFRAFARVQDYFDKRTRA